jgi:crotonobetainyl-CoA:carnitine CoA-transferase CaiB-like acyl-CoA transferase
MEGRTVSPFEGVRIIDLTHVLSGPFCTYQLALLGADVIKLEQPGLGDYMRRRGSDDHLRRRLMGDHFLAQNANKRSLAVDLKDPRGAEVARRLASGADVLAENFRAGVAERLGLGYDRLAADNPKLVYLSLTAYGSDGPESARGAYDNVVQAAAGMMAATGLGDSGPLKTGTPVLDFASGTMAAFAVAAALFQRQRTGRGQFIDLAMQDTAILLMGTSVMNWLHGGIPPKRHGNDHALAAASCYEAADGEMIMLGCCTQSQFERLCTLIGRDDLAADPRFADVNLQDPYRDPLAAEIGAVMRTRTADEWERHLADEVPAARVRGLDEALGSEQVRGRRVLQTLAAVPEVDADVTVPAAAFSFAHDGPVAARSPPLLGEHSFEVLAEAGYDDSEIAALERAGVVAGWSPELGLP